MSFRFMALTIGFLSLLSAPSYAFFGSNPQAFTDKAIYLDVNDKGFDALTEIAQEQLLSNIENQVIPDINFELPLMAKFHAKKISISAKFKRIKITPQEGGLDMEMFIENISINIGEVRASNFFMPHIGTSCYDTKITFGNGKLIPIKAKLGLKVRNGKIQMRDRGIQFHLGQRQYVTSGPSRCIGAFGVDDSMAKFVVENVLASARPAINLGVNLGVKVLSSKLGDMLFSQLDKVRIPVTIPNILVIPETKILLGLRFNYLQITKTNMRVVLGIAIEKNDNKSVQETELPKLIKYATVGINPEFLNKVIATVLPKEGTTPFEITPDFHEMVADLLLTSEFANFFPDLDVIETDTEQMRMFLSLMKPATLAIKEDSLAANLSGLQLKLMVKKDGEWMDYFFIDLGANVNIKGEMLDAKLKLFPTVSGLKVDGNFAADYKPSDATFFKDEFKDTFQILFDMLTQGEDGMAIDIPLITLGRRQIGFDKLKIKAPFVYLDIIGMRMAE